MIFGNSASGKSTRAKQLCAAEGLAHLDLDTLAWEPSKPPERRLLKASQRDIEAFMACNDAWVIEGCYADLIERAMPEATHALFLDLPVAACVDNARRRPWEPHKYASKQAQDENLNRLIEWIREYDDRTDTFSRAAHRALYDAFSGNKAVLTSNDMHISAF